MEVNVEPVVEGDNKLRDKSSLPFPDPKVDIDRDRLGDLMFAFEVPGRTGPLGVYLEFALDLSLGKSPLISVSI